MIQYPAVHVVSCCLQRHLLRPPPISATAVTSQHMRGGSKQAWLTHAVKVTLTWRPCKQYREEVDAYSDGIEKRKSSEAIGDGVHLWKSVSETRLVPPVQRHLRLSIFVVQNPGSFTVELTLFRINLRINQKRIPDIAPDSTGDKNQEATLERQVKKSF